MATLLCVPILVLDEHTALADAAAARDAGADLVEFRIDEFFTGSLDAHGALDDREVRGVLRLVAQSPLPCIVTCRAAAESGGTGGYDGDEMARIALFERLGTAGAGGGGVQGQHPPRYIDIEYAAYVRSANIRQKVNLAVDHPRQQRDVRTGLILSMHDFEGRPRDLLRRVSLIASEPAASVVKVAYTARSVRDNLELFDLLSEGGGTGADSRPMIALAMGRFGLMSRVLAPKFGGLVTYASLRSAAATAPGQPTVRELTEMYRFPSINPRTRVYGVIGWPVEHSLGPVVHNAGFESLSSADDATDEEGGPGDAVYLPLPVPPEWEHFKATVTSLIDHPRLGFGGCSVTLPHKMHLVRLAREATAEDDGIEWSVDRMSEICSAANTLRIERDPAGGRALRASVTNTDAPASAECLRQALGELQGRLVAIIGAGGAARAVAAGLLRAGAEVTVHARNAAQAEALAEELDRARRGVFDGGRIAGKPLDRLGEAAVDAVVNCTPVGMHGGHEPNRSVLTDEQILGCAARRSGRSDAGSLVVFDTVYRPLTTPLLAAATRLGMRTVDGLAMFVAQAAMQFTAWTGRAAPRGLFAAVAREALAEGPRS